MFLRYVGFSWNWLLYNFVLLWTTTKKAPELNVMLFIYIVGLNQQGKHKSNHGLMYGLNLPPHPKNASGKWRFKSLIWDPGLKISSSWWFSGCLHENHHPIFGPGYFFFISWSCFRCHDSGPTVPETNRVHLPKYAKTHKETIIFELQPSIFRCYVSFREGVRPRILLTAGPAKWWLGKVTPSKYGHVWYLW